MAGLPYRELYCPAHFGNSYEAAWPGEMEDLLSEARHWGFNAYGDWFDSADLKSPWNNPRHEYLLPQALWERKVTNFRSAAHLGLATDLLITPNHVFLDQLAPDLLADTSVERYFGQLLCPSRPAARKVILDNYLRVFTDLREQGVTLGSLSACPFDYGGCACPQCAPYIVAFGRLFAEIHDLAKTFFPHVTARLIGWWWTREEHEAFARWADEAQPGRFASLAAYVRYGETAPDVSAALPAACERHAFVHIGYGDRPKPDDLYGPWGPTVAPTRLPETVANLQDVGVTGFVAYSEGVFDDVNKALLAGLSSGEYTGAEAVLAAYAGRYFGASGREAEDWAHWIAQWGSPYEVDTAAARRDYERLAKGAKASWRLAQLEAKLGIFECHAAVVGRAEWDEERLAAANRFFAERERLQRGIWGLGPVRHVIADRYHQPDWFAEWRAHSPGGASRHSLRGRPDD